MTEPTNETSTPVSTSISPEVVDKLKRFNVALTALEDALNPHINKGFEKHLERPAVEIARIDIMSLFALNSLAWTLAAMTGQDPKQNLDLSNELKRTKEYVGRLKKIEDRKVAPRLNSFAAKAFVRNALYELPSQDGTNEDEDEDDAGVKKAKRKRFDSDE